MNNMVYNDMFNNMGMVTPNDGGNISIGLT